MGLISLLLMVVGWLLIIVAAFGSGFDLHAGNLHALDLGIVLVLLALCIGGAWTTAQSFIPSRNP